MGTWYYGNASYFDVCGVDCCTGSLDIAYGNFWTDQSCEVLPQLRCPPQVYIGIEDQCTGMYRSLPISAQCSCKSEPGASCSMDTRCHSQVDGQSPPILDLLRNLFVYMHGDVLDGRVRYAVLVN